MESCSLTSKTCVPCRGGIPPLEQPAVDTLLRELQGGWTVNDSGHLFKKYPFPNFITAMEFANKIAAIAEEQAHHPDITISWGMCKVEIWTHKINGLTESDFILAAKLDVIMTN
jgi:4a-hydroxytetrahydrobiopterin dehydratase